VEPADSTHGHAVGHGDHDRQARGLVVGAPIGTTRERPVQRVDGATTQSSRWDEYVPDIIFE
jgi:hypothetical protein